MQVQYKSIHRNGTSNLKQALFGHSLPDSTDLRGFIVYDRNHKKIGSIGEVYYDSKNLTPRYIEIVPLRVSKVKSILYPYEYVDWRRHDGPAFIASTLSALLNFEDYDFNRIMEKEGHELSTFNEAIGLILDKQASQGCIPMLS